MGHRYEHLLSPYQLTPNTVIKNRMLGATITASYLQGTQDYPTDALIHHYVELARNGAAVLNFYHIPPQASKMTMMSKDMAHNGYASLNVENKRVQNYYCQLTEECHYYGTKMLLYFYFPVTPPGYTYLGKSGRTQGAGGVQEAPPTRPMPKEMIRQVQDFYVNQMREYMELGFDGVTFHLEQYLIASMDIREDEYGGSVENRARFLYELFGRFKEEFGQDFIIEGVMGAEMPYGYTGEGYGYDLDDTIRFAKLMEGRLDYLELRGINMADDHPTGYTHAQDEAPRKLLDYCRRMKEAGVRIPLSPNGGFQDPDVMEQALAEGICDFFSLTRPFICDYEYGRKILEERPEDITPCLQCDKCHGTYCAPWVTLCAVNPRYGMDHKRCEYERPSGKLKKTAVIGGGPIGMRAAVMAAENGHTVTLYEKTGYLGGQLEHADYYKSKWPLRRYRLWLVEQLKRKNVEIKLECCPTKEELAAAGYDAVLICTGSTAVLPDIEGAVLPDGSAAPGIRTCHDVWGHEDELGKDIIIVGGSEVGMETAIHLAQNGRNVTVLTRQDELGHDCSKLHAITMTYVDFDEEAGYGIISPEWTKYPNLKGIVRALTIRVRPDSVTYRKDGEEHTLTCDSVIVGGGVRPNIAEGMQYVGAAPEICFIGDVEGKKGNLQRGNRSAYAKVNRL